MSPLNAANSRAQAQNAVTAAAGTGAPALAAPAGAPNPAVARASPRAAVGSDMRTMNAATLRSRPKRSEIHPPATQQIAPRSEGTRLRGPDRRAAKPR